jgi:hypothetical protein
MAEMDWEEIPYKGFAIWIHKRRARDWIGCVYPYPKGVIAAPGPCGGEAVPGDFDSREAFIEAAERLVNEIQEERRQGPS